MQGSFFHSNNARLIKLFHLIEVTAYKSSDTQRFIERTKGDDRWWRDDNMMTKYRQVISLPGSCSLLQNFHCTNNTSMQHPASCCAKWLLRPRNLFYHRFFPARLLSDRWPWWPVTLTSSPQIYILKHLQGDQPWQNPPRVTSNWIFHQDSPLTIKRDCLPIAFIPTCMMIRIKSNYTHGQNIIERISLFYSVRAKLSVCTAVMSLLPFFCHCM